jgi:hypothetical protein
LASAWLWLWLWLRLWLWLWLGFECDIMCNHIDTRCHVARQMSVT